MKRINLLAGRIAWAQFDAVVFDLDDTLYLECDYVRSGFLAVGTWVEEKFGIADFGSIAWKVFQNGERGKVFDTALALSGLSADPSAIRAMVSVYRCHSPEIELLPDAISCLEFLKPLTNIGLITDGPIDSQERKFRALGLETWIDCAILTGRWGSGFSKPHPRAFEEIQRQFSCPPERCVYFADNPAKDFVSPRALGWATARVRRPGALHYAARALPTHDADIEIANFNEMSQILSKSNTLINGTR